MIVAFQCEIDIHSFIRSFSTRGGGRSSENRKLLRIGAGESSASLTDANKHQFCYTVCHKTTIPKMWGSKVTSMQPRKSMPHETTSGKTLINLLFLCMYSPVISDLLLGSCHFSSLVFDDYSLKFSKKKASYFEPFQFCTKVT